MIKHNIIHFVDATLLSDSATLDDINLLCDRVLAAKENYASVCVPIKYVSACKTRLQTRNIAVATVANFPTGQTSLEAVKKEIETALAAHADEIDMVLPYHFYLNNEKDKAIEFVATIRKLIPKTVLFKIILETGALKDPALIADASKDMINCGVDFLKTSTGKLQPGATVAAAMIMLAVIAQVNPKVGFKASGGIKDADTAMHYLELAEHCLGEQWLSPRHFRIGSSKL